MQQNNKWLTKGTKQYDLLDEIYPIKISPLLHSSLENHEIKTQFYPQLDELNLESELEAYFPEEEHVTSILVKKYPNRCMIYTTGTCFAHCRHCSRKAEWKKNIRFSKYKFDEACEHISSNSQYEEIILTGGDFFCNTNEEINYMLEKISEIKHIINIRLGTRCFTTQPTRIDKDLCNILKKYEKIVIFTQFNSHLEFNEDTIIAIRSIQSLGIPILNQSVLLKGVNDTPASFKHLISSCVKHRIIPYYLFHCFNVKSISHLRTTPELGISLTHQLVGNIGGWWIPRYIIIPENTGIKIPLCPNGKLNLNDDDSLTVVDFKGRKIIYR